MGKLKIELKDAIIHDLQMDNDFTVGCETCDYGSNYSTTVTIGYSKQDEDGETVFFNQEMYNYGVTSQDVLQFFFNQNLKEITIREFCDKFNKEVMNPSGNGDDE